MTIECSFGILKSRWRVFDKDLAFKLSTCEKIIIATILLHNFIISDKLDEKNDNLDSDNEHVEFSHEGRLEVNQNEVVGFGNSIQQRNILAEYFSSPVGSVSWQNRYI